MICRIADLIISVPDAGGNASRYQGYVADEQSKPDIIIDPDSFRWEKYSPEINKEYIGFLECEHAFTIGILQYSGFLIHASAVALNDRAYLFSGHSGIGKSTHTNQWINCFGKRAEIINDDKPPIRCINGKWFAFGSPWCGKDDIQVNRRVPLAGICFLKQGEQNSIRRLGSNEALYYLLSQTTHRFKTARNLNYMMELLSKLICEVPVFEMENYPGPDCVKLSYETMTAAAEEMGL